MKPSSDIDTLKNTLPASVLNSLPNDLGDVGSQVAQVCWPPSIAWYFSTASSRSSLVGTPCASRSGSPRRRREREDRLEGVRVAAGLTVQQRDPLRRAISVQEIHSW